MPKTTLAELYAELDEVEAQISSIMKTGKSYSVVGSHSVTNTDLKDLIPYRAQIKRRIFRFLGYTGRTTPNFEQLEKTKDY